MTVGAEEPEEQPGEDERLADDSTPIEYVSPEQKRKGGRPAGMSPIASQRLSEQIWEEYAGGMNTQDIGDLHGMTRVAVRQRLVRYRAKMGIESVEEAKALDLGRYEALIERVWTKAFQEPTPENVRSLAMLLDQRAKLLGLNAPKKLQVGGELQLTPSPAFLGHLDRIVAERNRLSGGVERPAIESGDEDVVDAELVDDD